MDINKKEIHNNSKCSICDMSPIVGTRYLCLECEKYEMCEECEKKLGEMHGHQMLVLRRNKDLELYKNCVSKLKNLNLNESSENKDKQEQEIIDKSKCSFICTNLQKIYITRNNNNFIPIEVSLKSIGTSKFPLPCYFVCDSNSQLSGYKVKLNQNQIQNSSEIKFNIRINLEKIKKTGTYKSIWQLRDEKDETFGEKITFIIKVIFDKILSLKNIYKRKDFRFYLQQNINELKSKPFINQKFSITSIKNALIKAKGDKNTAIRLLITEEKI